MPETTFEELKRYVCFGAQDESALRHFWPMVAPHIRTITELFYRRVKEHPEALGVFVSNAQVQRLQGTLCEWLELLFRGPWDEAYYERRAHRTRTRDDCAAAALHV
jgi:truncated hemoglobin YjbI